MKIFRFLFFFFCIIPGVFSQESPDPINPGRILYPQQMGIVIGAGIISQAGDFNVTCDCPAFEGGRGAGLIAGIIYEDDFFKGFVWGATAMLEMRPVESVYRQTELVEVSSGSVEGKKSYIIPGEFRNTASLRFTYLTFMPFVKYVQLHPIFLRMGAGLSTIAFANITHKKELLTRTALSPEGTLESVEVVDKDGNILDRTTTVEDGEYGDINSFQFSLNPAIGLDIAIGKTLRVAPVFQYSFPLTTISERGNNFKLNTWQIMAEVRYIF